MDGVRYRIVPGYPDYIAGTDGTLWSCRRGCELRKLNGSVGHRGHITVGMTRDDGPPFSGGLHRVVLMAFVGPCPEGMECCHNNGTPDDNRLENLRWDAVSENYADRARHGIFKGERHPRAKLTESDVRKIRASTDTLTALSKRFPVCIETLSEIRKGEIWKHVV